MTSFAVASGAVSRKGGTTPTSPSRLNHPTVAVELVGQRVKFDHHLFDRLTFVGQVDKKFIAVTSAVSTTSPPTDQLLLLFDQHAVHERIRLEKLLKEHFPNQEIVQSTETSALTITFNPSDIRIIGSFKDNFFVFGLEIDCDDEDTVVITRVPTCFVMREENELRYFRPSPLIRLTRCLIEDIIQTIKETGSTGGMLPQTLNYILASRACRGAVKFGDSLSAERCEQLLQQLGDCQLPFQCAHGRPSLSPIIDVRQLHRSSPNIPGGNKLNFQNLRMQCQQPDSSLVCDQ